MNRRLSLLAICLALSACATVSPSVPEGYAGPRAYLDDSVQSVSRSKANFFVAEKINDAPIEHSIDKTIGRNVGRGMSMTPAMVGRPLVAGQPLKLTVTGRTHYAAPILALTGKVHEVTGVVEFTPEAGGKYIVRGRLSEGRSSVWIEDLATQMPVGNAVDTRKEAGGEPVGR